MTEIPLVVRRLIPATAATVFDAFASAEAIGQWFVPSPDVTVEVLAYAFRKGGAFRLRYRLPDGRQPVVAGHFTRIQQPASIALTWIWQAPDPLAGIPMDVTFDFTQGEAGTDVVVTHRGIPSDTACSVHEAGWQGTLNGLEAVLCTSMVR